MLVCKCGNSELLADTVTLVLHDVPFILTDDGPQYDDTMAEQSEGWDYNEDSDCHCHLCGRKYVIGQDGKGNIRLYKVGQLGGSFKPGIIGRKTK